MFGRQPPALVGDPDRDVRAVALRANPDRCGLRRVPCGVGEEIVQHLLDAPPVGHHPRQAPRQVDQHGVPPAARQERVARPVHQHGHLRWLGRHRQRARVDAPRVQQVADEAAHAIGLVVDDPVELVPLGRVELRRGLQQRGGRTLDRGQRRAQLVAHHAQELGAQALKVVERGQVLHGDHHRCDRSVLGPDRRRVDQGPDAAPVGDREHHLLGTHRLAAAELPYEREFGEGDLAPVGTPARDHLQQLFERAAGRAQALDDTPRLAVERQRPAAAGIEDHDADRRGLHQRLQVGPRALLVAVGAGVGDRRRRQRGEQHQYLLVVVGELRLTFLPCKGQIADLYAAVAQRRSLEGLRVHQVRGVTQRGDERRQVRQPYRSRQIAEVRPELGPVRPGHELLVLLGGEAGADEILNPARVVDSGDHAVAGAGERARAVDDLLQDGGHVEGRTDAQDRSAERGDALA